MSKKDRLDKQKMNQDKIKMAAELSEKDAAAKAKNSTSKSAQKMLKKAKKEKRSDRENGLFLFAKILMLFPFAYSGLYYGGITVLGITKGFMEDTPTWIAYAMGFGVLAILVGIILSFLKKYFGSFIFVLGGTIGYMKGAMFIVDKIATKLGKLNGSAPELEGMDKDYKWGYYPILGVVVIAFILALVALINVIKKRKTLKDEKDNAPVKSIIN